MADLRKLRDYQKEINNDVHDFLLGPKQRGQVYAPTGSGKTECFAHTIHDLPMILKTLGNKKLDICIVHPRLALSQEQERRFQNVFGPDFHFTTFHSGAHVNGNGKKFVEKRTTNREELELIIANTDMTHVTFSSYDSFKKIASRQFDLLILDEAHNLVRNEYREALEAIKAKKALFYTATPIVCKMEDDEDAQGMNNPVLFGEIIAKVEPKRLIEKGYIVGPLVHRLVVQLNKDGDVDPVQLIAKTFLEQKAELAKHGMPFIQLLVASRGLRDHEIVNDRLAELWELIGDIVPVYAVSAKGTTRNGREFKTRMETLQEIKSSGKDAILMHYDTLVEGIDIDSLIGALIMRKLSKPKLLQTIGRCGRPLATDLNDKFEVTDMKKRNKPYSVITFPVVNGEHIGRIDAQTITDAFIIGGYGDLSDYLSNDDKKRLSEKKNMFDLGNGDDEHDDLSSIANAHINREYQRLLELGIVF